MLFFAYLYSYSPHSFSCLPVPCKDQRHYHYIPYRQTHASSHKVWWSLILVTQLSVVYPGHLVLSYFR